MATLQTLIKIAEKKLEQVQQEILKLDLEIGALQAMQRELALQVKESFRIAEQGEHVENFKDAYAFQQRAEEEQRQLAERCCVVQEEKAARLEIIRETFAEKKRFEILAERQAAAAKKQKQAKEQAQLDDMSSARFENN